MMEMRGATMDAAQAALVKSAPRRKARFFVFHCCWSLDDGISTASLLGMGIGELEDAGATSGFSTTMLLFFIAAAFGLYLLGPRAFSNNATQRNATSKTSAGHFFVSLRSAFSRNPG